MYCTNADIESVIPSAQLIQLTDDAHTGILVQSVVDTAIRFAQAQVDDFLRGRYTVPLVTVPDNIARITRDLAVYELWTRRPGSEPPTEVATRRKEARADLVMIQRGDMVLDVEPPDAQTGGVAETDKTPEDRVFTKETLAQW